MRIIPKANTLRKGILLYRGIRYRKGFGVHSPFVFNLITKVIEERCQYYSFYDIELIRTDIIDMFVNLVSDYYHLRMFSQYC